MAAVLDLSRAAAEQSLVFMWNGMPAAWRWRGRLYDTAVMHATWEDGQGRTWYRAESEEGLIFLLGRDLTGWTAVLWGDRGAGEEYIRQNA